MPADLRSSRSGSFGDLITALALAAVGIANLVLPVGVQDILGVDYLYVALALLAVATLFRLPLVLRRGKPWLVVGTLGASILPGALVIALDDYGNQKMQAFVMVAMSIIAASSLTQVNRGVLCVLSVSFGVALVVSVLMLTNSTMTGTGRVSLAGLNPIGVARMAGLGVVLAMGWAFGRKRVPLLGRGLAIGVAGLGVGAALMSGSRGPLLAAAVACAIMLAAGLSIVRAGARWSGLLVAVAAVIAVVGLFNGETESEWATGRGDSGRSYLYEAAWHSITQQPEGIGWGQFPTLLGGATDLLYPHNIYLEMAVEGGLIAVAFALTLTILALIWGVRAYRQTARRTDLLLLGAYIYSLVNAQLSSDVVGNRMLWVAIALIIARYGALRMHPAKSESAGQPDARVAGG